LPGSNFLSNALSYLKFDLTCCNTLYWFNHEINCGQHLLRTQLICFTLAVGSLSGKLKVRNIFFSISISLTNLTPSSNNFTIKN